jgi:hypothetical protein
MANIRERFQAVEQWTEPVKHHARTCARYQTITVVGLLLLLWVGPSWGGPPNPTGSDAQENTAGGANALANVTTGGSNTTFGLAALQNDNAGSHNTATGNGALFHNTVGNENTATGLDALYNNTDSSLNTATGGYALFTNTNGSANTAIGYNALHDSTGGSNIAVGNRAGSNLTSGDNNIYLGSSAGDPTTSGPVSESNVMRLGQPSNQLRTFIAGIRTASVVTGTTVFIDANGQLGVTQSSARYKRDIQPMGAHSRRLLQLRPVIFHYKQDAQNERQYGLIAEEVAKVYPELVTRNAQGEVESVRYQELTPMLLNELQHQQREVIALKAQNARLRAAMEQQQLQNTALETRLERLEAAATRAGALASR